MDLSLILKDHALQIGFDLVGVSSASAWRDLEFSGRWIERGYHGEMRYLANPKRFDPRLVLPSVKSVICVGLLYNTNLPYSTDVGRKEGEAESWEPGVRTTELEASAPVSRVEIRAPSPRAWISRYAWGRDYHQVMRRKLDRFRAEIELLAPGAETRVFVDTGPVIERAFARLSGIGWMGKNTCLINEKKGSWFFLGVILTSLDLEPDLPAPDRCGSCRRCLDACPTGALVEPYVMDASRCISYFTIELKGSIPEQQRAAMGRQVFGCDICQDVCPWNSGPSSLVPDSGSDRSAPKPNAPAGEAQMTKDKGPFQPLQITNSEGTELSLFNPPLEDLASLSEDDFRRFFARSPVKRAKFRGWLRNLCVAMGNSGDARFVPWLERVRQQQDPVVGEHADWALSALRGNSR